VHKYDTILDFYEIQDKLERKIKREVEENEENEKIIEKLEWMLNYLSSREINPESEDGSFLSLLN
jgi:hypothetical protein